MVRRIISSLAALLILAFPSPGFTQSKCDAGKLDCVQQEFSCLIKVYASSTAKGVPPDEASLQQCVDAFDGGADPAQACFAAVEAKKGADCFTTGDAPLVETIINDDVVKYVSSLGPGVLETIEVACNRDGGFEASDHPLFETKPWLDPNDFSMWDFGGGTSGDSAPPGVNIVCRANGFFSNLPDRPVDLTDRVAWSTSTPTVATVAAEGIVTTIAAGQTNISATLGTVGDSDVVPVNLGTLTALDVANRIGEPDPLSRPVGVEIRYGAVGSYTLAGGNTALYDVTELASWTTDATVVATVNNSSDKGVVTTRMAAASPVHIIAAYAGMAGQVALYVIPGP